MNMPWNVEFHQLFVERIPEAVAQRRGLDAAGLARIGINKASHEALLFDAFFEIRQHGLGADAGGLRQSANSTKGLREQLRLAGDDVVTLLLVPGNRLG